MRRALFVLALFACKSAKQEPAKPPPQPTTLKATIRWTTYGIPHVEAADLKSLAFGQAYAVASQNICVIADQLVKVRSERARYFGPGTDDANVTSDFGWLALGVIETAKRELPSASADAKAIVAGYTAGYNKYILDVKSNALPPECANAPWVKEVGEADFVAYWLSIGMIGSSGYFVDDIARAQPNATKTGALPKPTGGLASNGWAFGGDRTATGKGMLVANPHFPWEGELRFSEVHLTIPGQLDAYGTNLLGLPLISIGFTQHHAWTHTFSSSSRFVLYRLALDPSDPTKYRYGDEVRALEAKQHAIDVLGKDGSLAKVTRTLYRSHYGPIVANDRLAWSKQHAFALRDVTRSRTMFDQYLAMIRATSFDAFKAAFTTYQTTPFVNTMYADAEGNAWYIDGSAVPDLPAAGLAAWKLGLSAIPELQAAWKAGVIVVDGSLPMFELATDNATRPGAIPTARAPQLETRDYVMNANDSYWLTNPAKLLTGFSPFYGEAEKAPSPRTRMNHVLIRGVKKFTHEDLKKQILANRAMTSDLLRVPVIQHCKALTTLSKACEILLQWDGTFSVASKGAVLWREFLSQVREPWAEPFDPKRPIETPRGLGTVDVPAALTAALTTLKTANVAPDAALGDVQFTEKGGKKYGAPGSNWREGSTNPSLWQPRNQTLLPAMQAKPFINANTGLTAEGYPVNYGSSFILAVSFEAAGPRADAILTYSQSTDSRSPHFADQTARYASAEDPWRPVLFTRAAIDADGNLRVQEVSGR